MPVPIDSRLHVGTDGSHRSPRWPGVLNVRVPRRWEDTVNAKLASEVPGHANASLRDWPGSSGSNPSWFGPDGIHVYGRTGADKFAGLIAWGVTN